MQQNSMKIKQKQKVISTEEYLMKKGLLYQNRSEEQIKSITIPQNCIVMELEMCKKIIFQENHRNALLNDKLEYKHIIKLVR